MNKKQNDTKDAETLMKWIEKQKASGKKPNEFIGQYRLFYKQYEETLKKSNAIDFTDMVILCVKLFKENPQGKNHSFVAVIKNY